MGSGPVGVVTGLFNIGFFDPAFAQDESLNVTVGITIPIATLVGFKYTPGTLFLGVPFHITGIGSDGVETAQPFLNDFVLKITNFPDSPIGEFAYTRRDSGELFVASSVDVSVRFVPIPTPIPAAWLLCASALAGVFGFNKWRKRLHTPT